MSDTIATQVKEALADLLCLELTEVADELMLSDLGADSLDIVDIIQRLEWQFNIDVFDSEVFESQTVNGLIAVVTDRTGLSAPKPPSPPEP